MAWCRSNFTHASDPCNYVERGALRRASNQSTPGLARCGGSKANALRHVLRKAVRPQFRRPRRWGFKNPHSTYYVNVLRARYFPCLVYVNTIRDLDQMLSNAKHFGGRVKEARRFGILSEATGVRLDAIGNAVGRRHRADTLSDSDMLALQAFYGQFVRDVNVGLTAWAHRCLPARHVNVPLQRMVALAPRAPNCVEHVASQLAAVLSMDAVKVINVTRTFAASSLPIVVASLSQEREQRARMLVKDRSLLSWPTGSALQPAACAGALVAAAT